MGTNPAYVPDSTYPPSYSTPGPYQPPPNTSALPLGGDLGTPMAAQPPAYDSIGRYSSMKAPPNIDITQSAFTYNKY